MSTIGDNLQAAVDAAKNQLDSDAGSIAQLQALLDTANNVVAGDTVQLAALQAQVADLTAQLASIHKPVLAGLAIRDGNPPVGYANAFPVVHATVNWRDVETAPGVYDFAPIEAALSAYPGRRVGIRLFCGQYAPAFYLDADGRRVHIVDPFDGNAGDVPVWWTGAKLLAAYKALHAAIAAKYDNDLRLVEISAALTTTIYAEPFMRQTGSATTRANLLAAGYSKGADVAALHAMIDAHTVYKRTRVGIAHNPFQWITSAGVAATDVATTTAMLDYERQQLGDLAVLQNNSLDQPSTNTATENTMYGAIQAHGGAIAFQTLAPSRLTSALQVRNMLDYAVSLGACSVEFSPAGWSQYISPADAVSYNARLIANAG